MQTKFNPFVDIGYRGPNYFCDREKESKQLLKFISNRQNTTLFAFRRLGKTGLIKHVFNSLQNKKNMVCIYVDILGTSDKASFVSQLATAIYNSFPPENSLGKKIMAAIKSLRPTIQFDELTGQPSITISTTSQQQQETTIASLLTFLDSQNIQIVFAIDEFQQILSYPEKNMEAILRSQIQVLNNTTFIFCGSNQAMMHEIFNSAKRPFYASCTYLHLDSIEKSIYNEFIGRIFKEHKRTISAEAVDFICDWTRLHTFYTQYFCNTLFSKNIQRMKLADVQETAAEILKLQEGKFYQYRSLLTLAQWNLLIAIAKEQCLTKPHAKDFIANYGLGSSSIVTRTMGALITKEMVLHNTAIENPYYEVYDKFLMRWIQNRY
jgi:uncharacterized protein